MDRRVVAGIVGVVLAGHPQASRAQVGPDPSGLPPVGLAPIPSIGDTINNTARFPGTAPPPGYTVPTDPRNSGPSARIPAAPIPPEPVSMTTEPPIGKSLRSGYRIGPFSRFMGYGSPAGPPNPTTAAPATVPARPSAPRPSAGSPPTRRAEPSSLPEMPPFEATAAPATRDGRPAPFVDQRPEIPRPQADPNDSTGTGRPAPLAAEQPQSPRPRSSSTRAPSYQPAELPALDPATLPPLGPAAPTTGPEPPQAAEPPTLIPPPEILPGPGAAAPEPVAHPTVDPEVKRVVDDGTAIKLKPEPPKELPFATLRAAAVGDEVITIEELNAVVSERMEEMKGAGPMTDQEKRQVVNMIASQALDHMIDQAVILQEANRQMKSSKAQTMFNEFVDKTWREDELPPLLRKTSSANEYELKRKLAEQGKSYDGMKEAYRKKMLARDFLGHQVRNKVSSDLAEQRAYYNEHLKDYEQPARFTWREIEISFARNPNRAEARARAEAVLARLLRDEDFGEVARAVSDGPTASKGGLYPDMTPGSYGIPVVNDELNRLPVGQVSTILEAPGGFHIVRVESRREAGPLRFDEVQDKIRPKVMERNYQKAVENYLNKLRERTLIRTMFDNSESDPKLARRNDSSIKPVSNR